ncbi:MULTISPECIES: pyridoxamine 5'-phosphate oxidase family protein [Xanthomonas]|uniref:pyridoxamine 5'-phosphate oxidase family protein n=1 Tax=Xanthomonas TaxID=338 RepID=UPI0022555CBC|nr:MULTISPECIES: pyridoxamine 5'-phosphate oxidase family protein [Xanthomonas]MCW0392202.1 Flavohemoprotein [Xanthomonas sacchari]MDY4283155.1 pyridoxamine 5'-phosphate oxidase family protein [Xanthomonas sp. LF06-19]
MNAPTAGVAGWDLETSPFHPGELAVQQRAGASAVAAAAGRRSIRRCMPEQHRDFFAQLPLFVLAGSDAHGQPWATLRVGQPGFLSTPDPRTLRIAAPPLPGDPLAGTWRPGAPFGGLGIALETRRRNRVNGSVSAVDGDTLTVAVEQSFGNCPQYINSRSPTFAAGEVHAHTATAVSARLSDAQCALLARCDTFFIASANTSEDAGAARGADVSHRGGLPGFVRVDDARTLTTPDFSGNRYFNTLGNLLHDPRAGLLFIDFERGDLLYLAARAEIVWDGPLLATFAGAQRVVRFHIREVRHTRAVLPWRWSAVQRPAQFAAASTPAAERAWRPLRIVRIVDEARAIRSFHFAAEDGGALPSYAAGQHLTLRFPICGNAAPTVRNYTLSDAPGGALYRITVKRQGRASAWLHDHAQVGTTLDAQMPRGDFVFDAASPRPVVFVSAGIGIAPMLAMLRQALADTASRRRLIFVHGAREAADRPFAATLARLAAADARLSLHCLDSRAAGHGAGRIGIARLQRILAFDDYDFYLCGPPDFMRDMYRGLRALNVADARIRFEAFGPSSLVRDTNPAAPADAPRVRVRFQRSGREAVWTPDAGTLLELAEAQRIAAPSDCRYGSCGTCATRVLSGAVHYLRPPDTQIEPGCALLCVARPAHESATPLVLDR